MNLPRRLESFSAARLRAVLLAQTSRGYWRTVRILRRLRSKAGVTAAVSRVRARRARGSARAVGLLVRRALPTAAASGLTVAASVWLDGMAWMPGVPAEPSADTLYGALAGFAGVFLGFYYTALGVVVEQVYAKGSRALRRLVLTGRTEEVYVWFVVYLGVTSLLLLAFETTGRATGIASVGLVTGAGIVALVSASRLMTGGLRYFDPTVLAGEARAEVERLYALVSDAPAGEIATTAARINAAPQLDVFVELAESGDASVAHHALLLLQRYWTTKPERSSTSAWWGQAVVRPDWFLSDSTSVEMAIQQGGHIREEARPDWTWVERPLVACVSGVLTRLVASGDWESAHRVVARVAETVRLGAISLLVDESAALLDAVTDVMLARWSAGDVETGREGGARPADLWDAHGLVVVQLVIGARIGWEAFVGGLPEELERISATSPGDAERLRFPVRRKERLRILARKLQFEATVEGVTPTPRWFWADFVAPALLWELRDQFERVETAVDRQQGDVRPGLASDPLASGTAARRTTEVRHLWELFRDVTRAAETSLRAMVRSGDYDLPEIPISRADTFDAREQIEDTLWISDGIWPLLRRESDPMAEELIGHAYARLMDRCIGALAARDLPAFEARVCRVSSVRLWCSTGAFRFRGESGRSGRGLSSAFSRRWTLWPCPGLPSFATR